MKILLVNPSLTQEKVGHYNLAVEKLRGIYPSLGLLYIAATLEKAGHSVEVIDFDIEKNPHSKLSSILQLSKPDIVGIHVMTWTFHQANKIALFAKEQLPSIIVVAGGAGVTCLPQSVMKYSAFDYGVIGEGEETVLELAAAIACYGNPESVKGIIFRKNGALAQNEARPLMQNLNNVFAPARHLVNLKLYQDVLTRERNFATMITSRGCPYHCIYCDRVNRMGSLWRSVTNQKVVEEIKELYYRFGVKEIMFFDDEFIIERGKILELCEMISALKLPLVWECRARVDLVDLKLLGAMKKSGCYRIRFGFESGDNGILRLLKKGITVEQSKECARITKESGIEIFGYFMLGCPGETKQTMEKTIELALSIDPDFAVFSKVILIPGSELFDWAVREDLIASDYWERFFAGEHKNTAPSLSSKELSELEIEAGLRQANRRFYLRPRFIFKRLSRIKSIEQLKRQALMAKHILGT